MSRPDNVSTSLLVHLTVLVCTHSSKQRYNELKVNLSAIVVARNITGQPTITKRTPMHQKWKQNVQHGGVAFIPCVWKIQCRDDCIDQVQRKLNRPSQKWATR